MQVIAPMVERSEKARLALVDAQAVLDEKLRKSVCTFALSLHVCTQRDLCVMYM